MKHFSMFFIIVCMMILSSCTTTRMYRTQDTDGDGVADVYDKCDGVPGPANNYGCPCEAEIPYTPTIALTFGNVTEDTLQKISLRGENPPDVINWWKSHDVRLPFDPNNQNIKNYIDKLINLVIGNGDSQLKLEDTDFEYDQINPTDPQIFKLYTQITGAVFYALDAQGLFKNKIRIVGNANPTTYGGKKEYHSEQLHTLSEKRSRLFFDRMDKEAEKYNWSIPGGRKLSLLSQGTVGLNSTGVGLRSGHQNQLIWLVRDNVVSLQ